MELRNIVCPSYDSIAFLRAWLPAEISDTSRYFSPSSLSDVPSTARDVMHVHRLRTLIIHDAHTTNPDRICDQEVQVEEVLTINAPTAQFEVVVVAPTLFAILFETPEIFNEIFGAQATAYLRLMGSYDPERAIVEAGITVDSVIGGLDAAMRKRLRATPTAKRMLRHIERLDAKAFAHENSGDRAMHSRPPPSLHWE